MMTQVQALTHNEQVIAQSKLEQYVSQQALSIAPNKSANFSLLQNFLSSDDPNSPVPSQAAESAAPDRQPIKHLLIGSPKAVTSTIHTLYRLGYADVAAWSPLLPTANPGEVMSILSKSILVQ